MESWFDARRLSRCGYMLRPICTVKQLPRTAAREKWDAQNGSHLGLKVAEDTGRAHRCADGVHTEHRARWRLSRPVANHGHLATARSPCMMCTSLRGKAVRTSKIALCIRTTSSVIIQVLHSPVHGARPWQDGTHLNFKGRCCVKGM